MTYDNILVTMADGIAVLTINRPEVRNALDKKTVDEFHAALDQLRRTAEAQALIITGAGDKVFVSGADVRALKGRNKFDALQGINSRLFTAVEEFEKPTIAAVNGYALGGGCELTLACDIRIAGENAFFGLPETSLGIIPGAGGTQRLPRLIGLSRAKELVLTGEIIDARRAEQYGLISRVVPLPQLMDSARETARKIISRSPLATRLAKVALNLSSDVGKSSGLSIEMILQAITFESKDKVEGMSAFIEKRKAKFTGD